jgi:hypothetical protein
MELGVNCFYASAVITFFFLPSRASILTNTWEALFVFDIEKPLQG